MTRIRTRAIPKSYPEWPVEYLPYFSHDVFAYDWPPGFVPSEWGSHDVALSQIASDSRNTLLERGITGTIVGISDKADSRLKNVTPPGWMKP